MKTYNQPGSISGKDKYSGIHLTSVNSDFNFETFVGDDCNRAAYTAALNVANIAENILCSPLMIFGGSGTGKTHLSHAIYRDFRKRFDRINVLITTGYDIHKHYQYSVRQSNKVNFFRYYEKRDVLIIDDIDYLIGHHATCLAMVQIMDDLAGHQKQIVLTANVPFRDPVFRNEKLNSRILSGTIVRIDTPSMDLKLRILKQKFEKSNITISEENLNYIAENVVSDIRKLEGYINTIQLHVSLLNKDVNNKFIDSIFPKDSALADIEIQKLLDTL